LPLAQSRPTGIAEISTGIAKIMDERADRNISHEKGALPWRCEERNVGVPEVVEGEK
jgi:hypothetical protein